MTLDRVIDIVVTNAATVIIGLFFRYCEKTFLRGRGLLLTKKQKQLMESANRLDSGNATMKDHVIRDETNL